MMEVAERRNASQSAPGQLYGLIRDGRLTAAPRQVRRGHFLYVQGEPGRSVFLLEDGVLKRLVYTDSSRDPIIDVHFSGDIVGETCVGDETRPDSAVAMTDCLVLVLTLQSIVDALGDCPRFSLSWIRHLSGRISYQQEIVTQFASMECKNRLVARLALLGRRMSPDGDRRVVLPARITQEDLAAIVGTTRSRIGLFLRELEEDGRIERVDGRISYRPDLLAGPEDPGSGGRPSLGRCDRR